MQDDIISPSYYCHMWSSYTYRSKLVHGHKIIFIEAQNHMNSLILSSLIVKWWWTCNKLHLVVTQNIVFNCVKGVRTIIPHSCWAIICYFPLGWFLNTRRHLSRTELWVYFVSRHLKGRGDAIVKSISKRLNNVWYVNTCLSVENFLVLIDTKILLYYWRYCVVRIIIKHGVLYLDRLSEGCERLYIEVGSLCSMLLGWL